MTQTVYKVRNNKTKLYMTGNGRYPVFNECGQVYSSVGVARGAIKTRQKYDFNEDLSLTIVEFEMMPTGNEFESGYDKGDD